MAAQYCGYQLLGRRFAIGATDSNDRNVKLTAVVPGQLLQGRQHVGDQQTAVIQLRSGVVYYGEGCSTGQGGADKPVAVEIVPFQGKKQTAGRQLAGIGTDMRMVQEVLVELFQSDHGAKVDSCRAIAGEFKRTKMQKSEAP